MDESGGPDAEFDNQNQPELRHRTTFEDSHVSEDEKEVEQQLLSETDETESVHAERVSIHNLNEDIVIPRAPRNLQRLPQQPSFLTRQFRTVQNFFLELIEFLLLFLTTLFNPMADVNTQVQEHNQRRMAREGRGFSSSCKPSSSFPGCGPSS